MEESIEDLLTRWGMPADVVVTFKNNRIEVCHLNNLSDDNLKELCPHMGTRINLKKCLSEYNDAQANTETATTTNTFKDSSEAGEQLLPEIYNGSVVIDENLSFSFSDLFQSTFNDFDLKTLLETSPLGKSVLQFYAVNGSLDTKRRGRLTDIIIRHLFTNIVNRRLTYEDYTILAGKIITLFPKESAATYFTRPIRKRDSYNGKSVAARGKLVDKVRNYLFQSGECKRKYLNTTESSKVKLSEAEVVSVEEDVNWLKNNNEPWSEVILKWNKTSQYRHGKDYESITTFMNEWQLLYLPKAIELIDEDFKNLYPGKEKEFENKWQKFFYKLIELKKSEIRTDDCKEKLLTSLSSMTDDEHKIPSQLSLMIHLVPPKGRSSQKKKFSIQECMDSLIIIVENPGDLTKTIEDQKIKAKKFPVQPYIILLGSLQDVKQLYLVIDEIRYTFVSPLKAFDTLFKVYHVFNAKYPKSSDHILLIIQRCIYGIITRYDNVVPYITDILLL